MEELYNAKIGGGMIGNIILKVRDKIQPIYNLHEKLRKGLQSAAKTHLQSKKGGLYMSKNRGNVADVFLQLKRDFLAYAPFLDLIVKANKAIDLMKLEDSGRKDLETIDNKLLDYATKMAKSNLPTNLNSLLARPVQHIMR